MYCCQQKYGVTFTEHYQCPLLIMSIHKNPTVDLILFPRSKKYAKLRVVTVQKACFRKNVHFLSIKIPSDDQR